MGKKIKTSKAFRAEWQRTLNERENYLNDIQKKLDQLANDEQARIALFEGGNGFELGHRVCRKDDGRGFGYESNGWIDRDGTIIEIGYSLQTLDDDYYNPTEVYKPSVWAWAEVQWDPTPNQKKNGRKGSIRRITLSDIVRVST